jgi:thiamine-monophosphate kinase
VSEFKIIEKYFQKLAKNLVARALQDDVAQFGVKNNEQLVVSKDVFSQNIHFLIKDGGYKIAQKLMRTNLSDIAAAGATPLYYMIGFGKSAEINEKFISDFAKGLNDIQKEFDLSLIGGDTVSAKESFFSATIFGTIKKDKNLARFNGKENQLIYVSGHIGDARLGLEINLKKSLKKFTKKDEKYFLNRHFFPTPRLNLGQYLIKNNLSNCAIDISDGLLSDLNHICKNSNLSAEIYLEKIPFSAKNLSLAEKLKLISAGDDYELIFTVDCKNQKKIISAAKKLNLKLTCIGKLQKKSQEKLILLDENFKKIKLKKLGYEHF